MRPRPSNHVTRAMEAARSGDNKVPELPLLDRYQLERLEELYPHRCLGRMDTVEEHLRYAGMVELVDNLRARFEAAHDDDDSTDPLKDGELVTR